MMKSRIVVSIAIVFVVVATMWGTGVVQCVTANIKSAFAGHAEIEGGAPSGASTHEASVTSPLGLPENTSPRHSIQGEESGDAPVMTGRVIDDHGAPIVGASVLLALDPAINTETDSAGYFILDDKRGWGTRRLIARAKGMVAAASDCVAGRVETIRLGRGVGVTLRLKAENEHGTIEVLPRCDVLLSDSSTPWLPLVEDRSDAQGELNLWTRSDSRLTVRVSQVGRCPWTAFVAVSTAPAGVYDIIVPYPSVRMEVEVNDSAGRATLEGVKISCNHVAVGETDRTGRLVVSAFAGSSYELTASRMGYCDQTSNVRVNPGVSHVDVSIEVTPSASLIGRVESPNGTAVVGAEVTFVVSNELRALTVPGLSSAINPSVAVSDSTGVFVISGIGSRFGSTILRLRICVVGYADYESDTLEVRNSEQTQSLVCRLSPGLTVRGRVTSRAVGIRATVYVEGATRGIPTDDEGRYQVAGVSDAVSRMCAFADEHRSIKACAAIGKPVNGVSNADIRCDYEMMAITGTVTTQELNPIINAEVRVEFETLDEEFPAVYKTRTDAAGRYSVDVPVAGGDEGQTCAVGLRRWNDDCRVDSVRPPAVVDLKCQSSGFIEVSVIDKDTHVPIALEKIDLLWLAEGEEPLVCRDRANRGESRLLLAVPTGTGVLNVQYKDRTARIDTIVTADELMNLGVISL